MLAAQKAVDSNDDLYFFDAKSLGNHIKKMHDIYDELYAVNLRNGKEYKDVAFYKGITEGIRIVQEAIIQHMKIDDAKLQMDSFKQASTNQGSESKCS